MIKLINFLLFLVASVKMSYSANLCNSMTVGGEPGKIVCVCTATNCPEFKFDWPQKSGQFALVETTRDGKRFNISQNLTTKLKKGFKTIEVHLDDEKQSILGWGGAFTDAFGVNLNNLSSGAAEKLLESYYGENGLGYNFGRVPISGSDFSTHTYTYDDSDEPDYELKHWSLAPEDLTLKIPILKKVKSLLESRDERLKLFGSSWSAPIWMKNNHAFVKGRLIDDDRIMKTYAEYLVKFYEAYEKEGLKFWGGTVQNEPVASFLIPYFINSLQFDNKLMIKFVSKYLGPALHSKGYTKDKFKLMIGDDSLGFINYQVPTVMADPEVSKYISGLAFHWYTSGIIPYSALTKVYDSIKDKIEFVMMSEACTGSNPTDTNKVDLGSWSRGHKYASDIIEDLSRQTGAWIDWNLALDMGGGPNWANNFVDSPIIVNGKKDEFYKQPMYYAIGHFSRFFRPGSTVVSTKITKNNPLDLFEQIKTVAVHRKETGHVIVNILNGSNKSRNIDIQLLQGNSSIIKSEMKNNKFKVVIDPLSINSFILKL